MVSGMNTISDGIQPNVYTYVDNMNLALDKFSKRTSASFHGCTMSNTKGRDNAMYYISDNHNLEPQDENQFNALMSINNINPGQTSAMSHKLERMNSQLMSNSGLLG